MSAGGVVALSYQEHQGQVAAVSMSLTITWAVRMVCGRSGVARSRLRKPTSR
jgi:hypothetical protein